MKTKFLLLLFTVISVNVFSQSVFPESDAIWNIQINGEEHYYGLSGDTTFNDTVYNKLYLLNDTTLVIDPNDEYVGGFRQEGKKVWFRPSFSPFYPLYYPLYYPPYSEETLLYDFSKNEGDTIWHDIIPGLSHWNLGDSITVSLVTSIDIDEQGCKIYHTELYSVHNDGGLSYMGRSDSWMEGIGSINHGLFWFLSNISVSGNPKFHLACFKQGNEVRYMDNPNCNACFCWSSTSISEKNSIPFEVLHEKNCIRIRGKSSDFPCLFKLFTPLGELWVEKQLQSNEDVVPINQLKSIGLYQIQKDSEIIETGKIMIK
jgi:hypothetical protein